MSLAEAVALAILAVVADGCGSARSHAAATDDAGRLPGTDSGPVDAGGDATAPDAGPDGGSDSGAEGGTIAEWVMNRLEVADVGTGFDLDEHATRDRDDAIGCGKPDGDDGEDNRLEPVLRGIGEFVGIPDLSEVLAQEVADGGILVLVRAIDLDDVIGDLQVTAHLFSGVDVDADHSNDFEGEGAFWIDRISLEDPADESTPLSRFDDASVVGGILSGGPGGFALLVPLDDVNRIELTALGAQVRWRFGPRADAVLTDGILGGYVPVEDLLAAISELDFEGYDFAAVEDEVRVFLGGQADIDVLPPGPTEIVCGEDGDCAAGQACAAGSCVEPDGRCDAISVGLSFTAVSADIVGIAPGP